MHSTNDSDQALSQQLRGIGRLPRIASLFLLLAAVLVSFIGYQKVNSWWGFGMISLPPLVIFILSLRIRAVIVENAVEIRSYLVKYSFNLSDQITFDRFPYSGMWNGFSGIDGPLSFGLNMISVIGDQGPSISLPATMCGRQRCEEIVRILNEKAAAIG